MLVNLDQCAEYVLALVFLAAAKHGINRPSLIGRRILCGVQGSRARQSRAPYRYVAGAPIVPGGDKAPFRFTGMWRTGSLEPIGL
jgi:hypothetical protein